jgi:hypothetical protein
LDNVPLAKYRYDQDTTDYQQIAFTDLSYYEPAAWHWDFGDGSTSQDTCPVHVFPKDGVYEVCLTMSNDYGSHTYCRSLHLGTTASEEALPSAGITLFHNPCQEATNLVLHDYLPRRAAVTLYDLAARPVLRRRVSAGWDVLHLDDLAPGLYFYEIMDEGKVLGKGKVVRN